MVPTPPSPLTTSALARTCGSSSGISSAARRVP
uniref:Uncharacterized protein n=1 Tax=Arundo donax TaxID=35708 RepID=A0A0A9ABN4_ARUDO